MRRKLLKPIYDLLRAIKWLLTVPVGLLIGRIRSTRQIVRVWPDGDIKLGPKVALFMHFDRRGGVRPQLLDYMRELAGNGRDVVFVSNASKIRPEAMAALQGLCACIIVRRNVGYDFGAWRDALDHLGLPRAETEEIICANDSVFGPLLPLGDTLRRLDYGKADVWGLTENWQVRYHLQSFFLAFGPKAIRAEAFRKFWRSVRPVPLKFYVVKEYEVGITQAMIKGGLSCAALWSYEALIKLVNREAMDRVFGSDDSESSKADPIQKKRKLQVLRIRDGVAQRMALNPTSDLWRQLLMSGFPFIKRELLRDNPTWVEDVGDWEDVVRDELGADPDPILLDLRTMLKGSAP
jgi:hypothetical protein